MYASLLDLPVGQLLFLGLVLAGYLCFGVTLLWVSIYANRAPTSARQPVPARTAETHRITPAIRPADDHRAAA